MPKKYPSFNDNNESLEIEYPSDCSYEVSTNYEGLPTVITEDKYPGLPPEYYGKTITWIFRFDLKANGQTTDKTFHIKFTKSQANKKYVIYIEGKTTGGKIKVFERGTDKDFTVGDPAVGISN